MISVEEGSTLKGGGSRHSSQGSGPKGPSDEMWHVTDASTSTQDPSEPDTQDNMSDISENGELAKPSGKSLWRRGSFKLEFTADDPDDSNDENVKKQITKGLDSPLADGPSKSIFLPIIKESPFPLPVIQMTRSPATKKTRNSAKQRKIDEMFMAEALLEAKKAADVWEVPVGAVLVKDGKIIARGYNLVEELRDSTAHAEMICIRKASTNLRSWRLTDTTLYITLEPCPMCAGAILQARIDTVVWGAMAVGSDPRLTDYDMLLKNIHDLKEGKTIEVPIYDFKSSFRTGYRTLEVPSSRIVIIEGIYALSEKLSFSESMVKLGNITNPKTYVDDGEVRKNCRFVNT
ncbi:cytidine deaminase-like protein [Artemisia annua]|uniref:Cytidine deaminase-like protein n=1 Tax=Artemisia annua TaxID=35608 RepID=A0A2U1KZ28_ARTAN|nr:cytidine deaminase-like protein [Artemisia annua]